jgi:ubiquinone/menaquinone biosynthesis C-methylase UbiE
MKINKKEYYEYINNNKNLSECQKKMLINYNQKLNNIYKDKKSNEQIKTLLINCYKNNLLIKIAKIKILFYTFFNKDFTNKLMNKIIKENLNDDKIIEFIIDTKKNNNISPNKKYTICSNWSYIIENMIIIYKKINNNDNLSKINYLDIGCGSGNKTQKIAKILKLDMSNVYGADISNWGPYNQKEYLHKFNFIKIENEKINIEDNHIDFCSCILTLHHIKNLSTILLEIKRILKPNGILLLIEHNNYDDTDNLILDILHMLYGYLYDNNNRYLIEPDYAQYNNWVEWNFIMEKYNFKNLKSNPLFTELSNDIRYDNMCYSFYKNLKE